MDIVVTGYAGLEGSIAVYNAPACFPKLKERYSESFFAVFENADIICEASQSKICTETEESEGECDKAAGTSTAGAELNRLYTRYHESGLVEDGSEGGVLAALWRLLKANKSGGMYAQKSIPVLQQTIEVCEMFSLNPYRLHAPGCRVWLSSDTGELARAAATAGVPLNVIGFTSKGVAIRRTDTEGDSSLRRPEGDELDKVTLYFID